MFLKMQLQSKEKKKILSKDYEYNFGSVQKNLQSEKKCFNVNVHLNFFPAY